MSLCMRGQFHLVLRYPTPIQLRMLEFSLCMVKALTLLNSTCSYALDERGRPPCSSDVIPVSSLLFL